jgi:hypothetical protein
MPQVFIGDVFGLNTVYDDQVLNIEQRNFINWSESATYGYYVGGDTSPTTSASTIDRIDFFNETVSLPGKNLPAVRGGSAAIYSTLYGYISGGDNPTPTTFSSIVRLDLSTENISLPGYNIPQSRGAVGSFSSFNYGYFGGGYVVGAPGSRQNRIDRMDFSTETTSLAGNNLPIITNVTTGVKNLSYGYFGGGLSGPTAATTSISSFRRLDFVTEVINTPSSTLTEGSSNITGIFNVSYGYFVAGLTPSATPTRLSRIDRLDFTTETRSTTSGIPAARSAAAGALNNNYGYVCGGTIGLPPTLTSSTSFDRIDYSTETTSNLPATNLTQSRRLSSYFSAGQSIDRGSKTYGYFGGGGLPYINTITRINFSTETVSDPGKNLPGQMTSSVAVASNYYGYFGGGYTPPNINTITRLDFSNETISNPGKNLPIEGSNLAATSSSSYGYFGGGETPGGNISAITRLEFSNETVSNPGKNLPSIRRSLAATSSSSYGYFGGGFPNINTITRLEFSNETVSNPGNNLPSAISSLAATSSSSYGYFGGGYNINTITRLDFSNETVSLPTKNLPTQRFALTATSSAFYGYFGGGYSGSFSLVNTISRLDFSNETVGNAANNLPTARSNSATLSNSN